MPRYCTDHPTHAVPGCPACDAGWREILARLDEEERARVATLNALALDERPRAFHGRDRTDCLYLVHRDTYPSNRNGWRVTRLSSEAGELIPWGHSTAPTYRAALDEARDSGADLRAEVQIP